RQTRVTRARRSLHSRISFGQSGLAAPRRVPWSDQGYSGVTVYPQQRPKAPGATGPGQTRVTRARRLFTRQNGLLVRERFDDRAEGVAALLEVLELVVARARRAEEDDVARLRQARGVVHGPLQRLVAQRRRKHLDE